MRFRQRWTEEVVIALDWAALAETLKTETVGILVADDVLSDRRTAPLIRCGRKLLSAAGGQARAA